MGIKVRNEEAVNTEFWLEERGPEVCLMCSSHTRDEPLMVARISTDGIRLCEFIKSDYVDFEVDDRGRIITRVER